MPANAAIDNETLDHLLSVVNDGYQYKAIFAIRKCLQRPSSRIDRLVRETMFAGQPTGKTLERNVPFLAQLLLMLLHSFEKKSQKTPADELDPRS